MEGTSPLQSFEKIISKVPLLFVAIGICLWMGYDYYDWLNEPRSELGQRKNLLLTSKQNLDNVKKKLSEAEEFFRNLDTQRLRIRQLTSQLENTKAVLSSEVDVANFIKMVTLEAKKLRLNVKGIKPAPQRQKEFYIEVPFNLDVRGAYVQILLFYDRISKLQHVVKVSDFSMKPTGSPFTKYVELEGSIQLVTYKYLGTQADEVRNKPELKLHSETGGK